MMELYFYASLLVKLLKVHFTNWDAQAMYRCLYRMLDRMVIIFLRVDTRRDLDKVTVDDQESMYRAFL